MKFMKYFIPKINLLQKLTPSIYIIEMIMNQIIWTVCIFYFVSICLTGEAQKERVLLSSDPLPSQIMSKFNLILNEISPVILEPNNVSSFQKPMDEEIEEINLQQLQSLVSSAINGANKVKGKQVIILVSKTGAGKTTMIYPLVGIGLKTKPKFGKKKNQNQTGLFDQAQQWVKGFFDSDSNEPFVFVPEKPIEGFTIGHNQYSQTKIINIIQKDGLVFVDTPGLKDTSGSLVQISNAVGIQFAIKQAQSIRFIFVITQNTIKEDRGGSLRSLISDFIEMAPDLPIDTLMSATNVIFSHIQTKEQYIVDHLKNVVDGKAKNGDPKVQQFITEIYKKLSGQPSKINFVGIGSKQNMINLKTIADWKKQMDNGPKILHPQNWFSLNLQANSILFLQGKLKQLKQVIIKQIQRNNFKQLDKYYSMAQYLKTFVHERKIQNSIRQCISELQQSMQRKQEDISSKISFALSLSNCLSDEYIQCIRRNLHFIKEAEALCEKYHFQKRNSFESASNIIEKNIRMINQYIQNNEKNFKFIPSTSQKYHKIYLQFGRQIQSISKFYKQYSAQLLQKLNNKLKEAINNIEVGDYLAISYLINFFEVEGGVYSSLFSINITNLQQNITLQTLKSLKYRFSKSLQPLLHQATELLDKKYPLIEKLSTQYQKWMRVLENQQLNEHLGGNNIYKLSILVKQYINSTLLLLSKDIQDKILKRQLNQISNSFNMYSLLRQIDDRFTRYTAQKYYGYIADVKDIIKSDFKNAMKILSRSATEDIVLSQIYDLKRILDINEVVKNLKWVQGFLQKGIIMEIYNETLSQLNKKCVTISNILIEQLKLPNKDSDKSKPLKNGLILIEVASQIDQTLGQNLKSIKNTIKQIATNKSKQVQNLSLFLSSANLTEFEKIITNYKNLVNFLNKNSINEHILSQFGLNISHLREEAQQTMQIKFEQLLQEIQQMLEQKQFDKAKQKLQILKKYKGANKLFGSKISERLKEKLHKYWQVYMNQRRKVPQQIRSEFEKGNFKYVQSLLSKFEEISGKNSYNQVVKDIMQMIVKEVQDIQDDLIVLYGDSDVEGKELNKQLKRFFQFSNMGDIINSALEQPRKSTIIQGLQKHYQKLYKKITDNIKQINFGTLKQNIDKFKKYNQIILMGIRKYLNLAAPPQFDKSIKQRLQEIKSMKIDTYERKFIIYEEIKKLNQQFQGLYKQQLDNFAITLKTQVLNQIESILNQAYDIKNNQKLKMEQKFLSLKRNCSKISMLSQFSDISEKISKSERAIEQIYKKMVYDSNYLSKTKRQDFNKFNQLAKQLKRQVNSLYSSLQRYIENHDYNKFYKVLPQFQKYISINDYLQDQKSSPKSLLQQIKTKIKDHSHKLYGKAKDYIFGNEEYVADFDRFLELQIISNGTEDKNKFHQFVVKELKNRIPQLSKESSIDSQYSRFKIIKRQEKLIMKLKHYVSQMSRKSKINDTSNIFTYISAIDVPNESKTTFLDKIRQMKKQILTDFWKDKNNYNEISNNLTSIKKISINEKSVNEQYTELIQEIRKLLNQKSSQIKLNNEKGNFKQVLEDLRKIRKAEDELKGNLGLVRQKMTFSIIIGDVIGQLERKYYKDARQAMKDSTIGDSNIKEVKEAIMQIYRFKDNLPLDQLQSKIDELVEKVLQQAKQKKIINRIYISMLEESSNNNQIISAQMISSYKNYFYYHTNHLNKMIRTSPQQAIKKFKLNGSSSIDEVEFEKSYKKYQEEYNKQKEKYILMGNLNKIQDNLKSIKQRIDTLIHDIKHSPTYEIKDKIPLVLANIFVYWSLSKSGQIYYRAQSQGYLQNSSYILQPHSIQILSILRFIGCDTKQTWGKWLKGFVLKVDHIQNQMMQIKTGEGKSLIMASMSILLALMGHKVDCVCYSKYLAQRDYDDFKQIFAGLGLIGKISYGNFKKISQNVINERVDIRNMTRQLFTTNSTQKVLNKQQQESRILIVDEVDTFFSQSFYGATYNPATSVSNKNIKEIINNIWKNRQMSLSYIREQHKNSEAYKKLTQEYKDCIQKLDYQLQVMMLDVKQFNEPKYIVKNGKIGYKYLDDVSFATSYGYRTMFAYIYESQPERGNVNPSDAETKKAISITSGKYSYAEIVDRYDKLFGVSGTLQTLSPLQQLILQRYNITKLSFAPSVYGQSRKKQKQIIIENDKNMHHQVIATKIQEDHKIGKPVLVFFKNQTYLKEFQKSPYIDNFRDKVKIVTEQTQDRKQFIKSATITGSITFFTASFGRGTDFVVFDQNVLKPEIGGVSVIQTFLSEQVSQQIQIKGRTARQGKQGTYQMILNRQQLLSEFGIDQTLLPKTEQTNQIFIKKVFKQQRQKLLKQKSENRQKIVQASKDLHNYSMKMRQKFITKGRIDRSQKFFFMTKKRTTRHPTNYIFALDQSGSMSGQRWESLKKSFSQILKSISNMNTLKDQYISVIKFDDQASIVIEYVDPSTFNANSLTQKGGGTQFTPAFSLAYQIMQRHKNSNSNFIFISDGQAQNPTSQITKMQQFAKDQQINGFKFDYTSILIGGGSSSIMENMRTSLNGSHSVVSGAQEVTTIVRDMLEANHMKQ